MARPSQRQVDAVAALEIRPADRVLELGCRLGIHFLPMLRHDPEGTRFRVERLLAPGGTAHFF